MRMQMRPLRAAGRALLLGAGVAATVATSWERPAGINQRVDLVTRDEALYGLQAFDTPGGRAVDVFLDVFMTEGEFGEALPDAGMTMTMRVARMDSRPTRLMREEFREGRLPAGATLLGRTGAGNTFGTQLSVGSEPLFLLFARTGRGAFADLLLSPDCGEDHCGHFLMEDLTDEESP